MIHHMQPAAFANEPELEPIYEFDSRLCSFDCDEVWFRKRKIKQSTKIPHKIDIAFTDKPLHIFFDQTNGIVLELLK